MDLAWTSENMLPDSRLEEMLEAEKRDTFKAALILEVLHLRACMRRANCAIMPALQERLVMR